MLVLRSVSCAAIAGAIAATVLAASLAYADDPPPPVPAFEGQTKAPAPATPSSFTIEIIATRLGNPWSLAFLPDGRMLVTETRGSLRILDMRGVLSAPITGLPDVKLIAAQGFHDVALDPNFGKNRFIYFTYFAPPTGEGPGTWPSPFFYDQIWAKTVAERRMMRSIGMERVARARLSDDYKALENVEVLADGAERRLVFARDGTLMITGADRGRFYDTDLDSKQHEITDLNVLANFAGRVARIKTDGTIPRDNPYLDNPLVAPEVYAFGFKDPEGAAINPLTGELWATDHGPRGGDEINIIRAGKNYGWPNVSYGRQYTGEPVGTGLSAKDGTEQPIYFWSPSIAPSAMMFYTAKLFPNWTNNLFVSALAGKRVVRLVLKGERVIAEESLLAEQNTRFRDIRQGPDGAVYVLTDDGTLMRLVPKK